MMDWRPVQGGHRLSPNILLDITTSPLPWTEKCVKKKKDDSYIGPHFL